jgi:hypothetical protein
VGEAEGVIGVLLAVIREGPGYGLFLNTSKTKVWWPHVTAAVSGSLSRGLEACSQEGLRLLEGLSRPHPHLWNLMSLQGRRSGRVDAYIGGLGDPQSELLLLRASVGLCKLMHLFRCTPPSMVGRSVEVLDAALHVALRHIVVGDGGGFDPLQDELAALPLCMWSKM